MWTNSSTASSHHKVRSVPEARSSHPAHNEQQRYQSPLHYSQAQSQALSTMSHLSSSAPSRHQKMNEFYSSHSATSPRHHHCTSSESSSMKSAGLNDSPGIYDSASFVPGSSPTQMSASPFSAQRRAYRQRRKDPSCDACRERKVKCDATDTSSCSECTSRAVRCQFTKETNRRMSSIKQMQDLDKQLSQAKQENCRLRKILEENGIIGFDDINEVASPRSPQPMPLKAPRSSCDFNEVRCNLREFGSGIFSLPVSYRSMHQPPLATSAIPLLPLQHELKVRLAGYFSHIHVFYPAFDWATFTKKIDRVYEQGTLEGAEAIWVSVFYAVLALGTLQLDHDNDDAEDRERAGVRYLQLSIQHICILTDNITPDHAISTLLVSRFLYEMNLRCAAWIWLSTSVRIGYEIGLHRKDIKRPYLEKETARQTWWTIYALDRFMSLNLGKPFLISDDDFEYSLSSNTHKALPSSMSESSLYLEHRASPYGTAISSIVQLVSMTGKAMQNSFLPISALEKFDEKSSHVQSLLPISGLLNGSPNHDSASAQLMFNFLCVRFLVYRHNLQCAPNTSEHADALVRCLATARHTSECIAHMLQVTSLSPEDWEPVKDWHMRLMSVADNTLCLHVWRSTLILSFAGHFQAALICVRAAAAIGNIKKVNMHCGRYLVFFLNRLLDRLSEERGDRRKIESDEELLAYVGGDLQGVNENSWTWLNDQSTDKSHPLLTDIIDEPMTDESTHRPDASTRPSHAQNEDFNEWNNVEILVRRHIQLSKTTATSGNNTSGRSLGMKKEVDNHLQASRANKIISSGRKVPDQASRISIANII